MGASPYRTLGSRPITVRGVGASLAAPARVSAGAAFETTWEGPDNERDFITIVAADAADKDYGTYAYTNQGSPAKLTAPEDPGPHEVRYLTGQSNAVLARTPIEVLPVSARVTGPESVQARSAR
jgi:Ca-activated chloride channel family protein